MLSPSSSLVRKEFKGNEQSPESRAVAQMRFCQKRTPVAPLAVGMRSESLLPAQGLRRRLKEVSETEGESVLPGPPWALSSVFPEESFFPGLSTAALAAVGPALRTGTSFTIFQCPPLPGTPHSRGVPAHLCSQTESWEPRWVFLLTHLPCPAPCPFYFLSLHSVLSSPIPKAIASAVLVTRRIANASCWSLCPDWSLQDREV